MEIIIVIQHNSPPIILTSQTYYAYKSNHIFIFLIMQWWSFAP